jgi:site-specific DNA recombinase
VNSDPRLLGTYDPAEQGVDEDHSKVTPVWQRRRELYAGAHRDLLKRLQDGDITSETPVPTPTVAKNRDRRGRGAIYLRVSTEEQARVGGGEEGYSIPFQRASVTRRFKEMGIEIAAEYVDLGKSGTTLSRPEFRRMFSELEALGITHIGVHKLDRLSRSPKVDYFVDEGREATRTALVSVSEYIDDTPQGMLNLQFMRGVAAYYSNNLATEVAKGINTKLQAGGTPGQAPLGYLNKQRKEGAADIRWVEIDPERSPHIIWAFEQYATGEWTLSRLTEALEARGLRNRSTPKRPSAPIMQSTVHRILTHPYYVGIVRFRGTYYEGAHQPLVSRDLWLRVQDILGAHNTAGEKDRQHPHYLKGSIFCGECGSRLIYSRNKGRLGKEYEYFFCIGRRSKASPCSRGYFALPKIEAGIEDFYGILRFSPDRVSAIRHAVRDELAESHRDAAETVDRAKKQLLKVERERTKLLEAHYAGAVPLDLLKVEMERLTRELNSAEKQIAEANLSLQELDAQLEGALLVAGACDREYAAATPSIRRLMNQGFFNKLFIAQDGTVEDAEIQEPFAGLLTRDTTVLVELRKARATKALRAKGIELAATGAEGVDAPLMRRTSPSAVLLSFAGGTKQTRPKLSFGPSSNKTHLAETEGFEPSVGFPPLHLSRVVH